jgi:hypothetical protein
VRALRALLIAALLLVTPAAAGAAATGPQATQGGRCTAWGSWVRPPSTIRVLRGYGPNRGRVETVSMRTWSAHVTSNEMGSFYPRETLRAQALAVKQYGWYWIMHWRGGRASNGACYDVRDVTDGYYRPETRHPDALDWAAVDATWHDSVRKWRYGAWRLFQTGYRAGAFVQCGTDRDGWHLMQHSAHDCGRDGKTWRSIVAIYYGPVKWVRG